METAGSLHSLSTAVHLTVFGRDWFGYWKVRSSKWRALRQARWEEVKVTSHSWRKTTSNRQAKLGLFQHYFLPKLGLFRHYFLPKLGLFQHYFLPKLGLFQHYFLPKSLTHKERTLTCLLPGRCRLLPPSSLYLVNHQYHVTKLDKRLDSAGTPRGQEVNTGSSTLSIPMLKGYYSMLMSPYP